MEQGEGVKKLLNMSKKEFLSLRKKISRLLPPGTPGAGARARIATDSEPREP